MSFLKIRDSRLSSYRQSLKKSLQKKYKVQSVPLNVIQDTGVDATPLMNINLTDLNRANNKKYTHAYSRGQAYVDGIKFKIDVIIRKNDSVKYPLYRLYKKGKNNTFKIRTLLNEYYRNMVPLYVVTEALDIPSGTYLISNISSKKQKYKGNSVWSMEFTSYEALKLVKIKNNNKTVLNSLKKGATKKFETNKSKLRKCDLKVLVYSKKQKNVKCVQYLQYELYKLGLLKKSQVDGWYGPVTMNAVKRFQKLWVKSHKGSKLKATGKVSKATLQYISHVDTALNNYLKALK